jgi:putative membrane protein
MKWILIRWLSLTAAILATSYLLNGIHVSGFFSAFLAAAVLGILNAFFRPIAFILTLPLNILTLGFFTFVLNAAMLKLASGLISGFEVEGFWTAVGGALLISLISWILNSFVHENSSPHDSQGAKRYEDDTIDLDHKGDDRWE